MEMEMEVGIGYAERMMIIFEAIISESHTDVNFALEYVCMVHTSFHIFCAYPNLAQC